jgi:hypothetical protein
MEREREKEHKNVVKIGMEKVEVKKENERESIEQE